MQKPPHAADKRLSMTDAIGPARATTTKGPSTLSKRLMAVEQGVLSTIGQTPLVRLARSVSHLNLNVHAKLEGINPGGSAKDRPAIQILHHGIESGRIRPGTLVVESSSGNMGVGLAQACACYGLRFRCVVDPRSCKQTLQILRAYGAEIDLVDRPGPVTGEFLEARIRRVRELLAAEPNSFWPNQYANIHNAMAYHHLMDEILSELGNIDYLFCATSTCGTLRGCADYAREHGLPTKIVAVDALGSAIFKSTRSARLLPGHGASMRPALFQPSLADRWVHVTDLDCVIGCRRLVREEGILAGASSGGVFRALDSIGPDLPQGSVVVLIFCDRGDRYLDTVYSDDWVAANLEPIQHSRPACTKNCANGAKASGIHD
jgi:N-(2-amino-2-carboxyethyl)-L-glutamate synthase